MAAGGSSSGSSCSTCPGHTLAPAKRINIHMGKGGGDTNGVSASISWETSFLFNHVVIFFIRSTILG